MIINQLPIESPFAVFDCTARKTIFRAATAEGDLPSDIAFLEVIRLYAVDDTIYVDVKTN